MMTNITIEQVKDEVKKYNEEAIPKILRAYEYALEVHGTQTRKSGELYISHPIYVAYILTILKADTDTICAALLHDVIEDGENITKEDIEVCFGKTTATLVDGVTKMKLDLFPNKEAQNNANTRKVIMGMKTDVRIIIIKLVDRLHNMMTLKYLPRNKQIQNALETLEIFVPLAKHLGLHQIKNSLEELSFKYLNKDIYDLIDYEKNIHIQDKEYSLEQTKENITKKLKQLNIENNINCRFKRNYSIYKALSPTKVPSDLLKITIDDIEPYLKIDSSNIHDLQSLKIVVQNIEECYYSLELLQKEYDIIPGKVKDCISIPKTNGYQSIHTTIKNNFNEIIQTQIRTNDMDLKDSLGIASYWQTKPEEALFHMHQELTKTFPFFQSLLEIDKTFEKDNEFITQIKTEILTEMIYPKTKYGKIVELPNGSTIMDFASHQLDTLNNQIIALVNGKVVSLNHILKTKDIVDLIQISNQQLPNKTYPAVTTKAKQKIKALNH